MALTRVLPFQSGYFACSSAQAAGAAALAPVGAPTPTTRSAPSAAICISLCMRGKDCVTIRSLFRCCHGASHGPNLEEVKGGHRRKTCLGTHNKLDKLAPSLGHDALIF